MPTLSANGIDLHYVERGAGEQTVVFAHSYLLDHRHFEPQIAALEDRYRVIAYDHRDHGESGKARGDYSLDDLVADGAAVIEQTGASPCHWVGLSTGGFVGMRLAFRRPELLRSVTLMDTSAGAEPLGKRIQYKLMQVVARGVGLRLLEPKVMRMFFGRSAVRDPELAEELSRWRLHIRESDSKARQRFGRAIWGRDDVLDRLRSVDLPALVIAGAEDEAFSPAEIRELAEAIPGALFEEIPRAGHICTTVQPDAVNAALVPFIDRAAASAGTDSA